MRIQLKDPSLVIQKAFPPDVRDLDPRKTRMVEWMAGYFLNLPNPRTRRALMLDIVDRARECRDEDIATFTFKLTAEATTILRASVFCGRVWDPVQGPLSDWLDGRNPITDVELRQEIDEDQARIVGQLIAIKALEFDEMEGRQVIQSPLVDLLSNDA